MNLFLAAAVVCVAESATVDADYQYSQQLLKRVAITDDNQCQLLYLKAVNAFALNDKKTATEAIEQFELAKNSATPIRYQHLVHSMKVDLEQSWSNPLSDIERDMRISGDRLQNGYKGQQTLEIQKQIVDKLDKLIKDEEDKKNKQMMKGDASSNPVENPIPAADSIRISGNQGSGAVSEKQLKQLGESWGSLSPQQKAKVVADLNYELPVKYRELIDAYTRSLNKK